MTLAKPDQDIVESVAELVEEILAEADGDLARAAEILARMVLKAEAAVSWGYVRGRL